MIVTKTIPLITVPIMYYRQHDTITKEDVDFKVYRDGDCFKAMPLLSKDQRLSTGLPQELEFVYVNRCIVNADEMDEDSLNAIKQILLEMEVLALL